jgi:hypothetical protein
MCPSPPTVRWGGKARTPRITPHMLTPMPHSQADSGPNQRSANVATPALLQTTWTAPNRSMVAGANPWTDGSTLPSVGTTSVTTPWAPMTSAAPLNPSSSTSARPTFRPASANRLASASPIPLAAPVTTAILPAASSMVSPPSVACRCGRGDRSGLQTPHAGRLVPRIRPVRCAPRWHPTNRLTLRSRTAGLPGRRTEGRRLQHRRPP